MIKTELKVRISMRITHRAKACARAQASAHAIPTPFGAVFIVMPKSKPRCNFPETSECRYFSHHHKISYKHKRFCVCTVSIAYYTEIDAMFE